METRKLGKTGMDVSVLGFGGAEVGYTDADQKRVSEILNGALDAGLNVIDTAECYLTSEELIGKTVSHRRKDFFLFTKCGHSRGYGNPDWDDPGQLQASLDQSLRRLKTDHVDLLQIHSCGKDALERGVIVEFMKTAKASGKTRFIGYSGEEDAALHAVRAEVFDTLQISISIADQHCLDEIVPEAAKRGLGVIAKRPVANAAWKHTSPPDEYYVPYWERLKKLGYDFTKAGMEAAMSTALRFTLSVPGVSVAIVGTQKPGRWQENARIVAEGPLDRQDFEAIRARWNAVARPDWVGQI